MVSENLVIAIDTNQELYIRNDRQISWHKKYVNLNHILAGLVDNKMSFFISSITAHYVSLSVLEGNLGKP